jgi:hypothetical protein
MLQSRGKDRGRRRERERKQKKYSKVFIILYASEFVGNGSYGRHGMISTRA